ncbi:MAG: pyridoxamine 5'-phosphate oxidase family protein [Candidatus Hodarchaeota archaeon]
MGKKEIEKTIKENMLCRIAFKGTEYPYIAPFQYVYIKGTLYFHLTEYGKKVKLLKNDKRVCVEIEDYSRDLSEYRFISLRGALEIVSDPQERVEVVKRMRELGMQRISENFLGAHGLKKEEGWSSFTPEKTSLIVKLNNIVEEIGLKSP